MTKTKYMGSPIEGKTLRYVSVPMEGKTIRVPVYREAEAQTGPIQTPKMLRAGEVIKSGAVEYTLERLLGDGGMGDVWKAKALYKAGPGTNDDVERYVAMKFIRGLEEALKDAMIKEAKITAKISNENIAGFEAWHYLKELNKYVIVMQYVEGTDVNGILRAHNLQGNLPLHQQLLQVNTRRIPEEVVGFVLFKVANALKYAHNFKFEDGTGLVHRDVSPGNILVNTQGEVKLTDFGIAVTTKDLQAKGAGVIEGKIPYMAPEQIFDTLHVDARTDLYSLGVVAYEMLTGIPPNQIFNPNPKDDLDKTIQRTLKMSYMPLTPPHELVEGISEEMSLIVCNLMAPWQRERFQSARELYNALGECMYGKPPTEEEKQQLYDAVRLCMERKDRWVNDKGEKIAGPCENGPYKTKEHLDKAVRSFIMDRKGFGISIQDVSSYLELNRQILHGETIGMPHPDPSTMNWRRMTLPLPYVLTAQAREKLEQGINPARNEF